MIMKFLVLFVYCALPLLVSAQANTYNIIPKPAKLTPRSGQFVFDSHTRIVAPIREPNVFNAVFVLMERLLLTTGFNTEVVDITREDIRPGRNMVYCQIDTSLGKEAYKLTISADRIDILAGSATGIFYAMQTIRQLLPPEIERNRLASGVEIAVPCAVIEDEPVFSYRGVMLDTSRHFSSINALRRYIDILAFHKINHLHLQLSNDQGWRIQIDKYPNLTQTGAWRDSTITGMQPLDDEEERTYNRRRYGGFYTKEQMRNVLAYAERRFVTIVPEISMPGHSLAALASYPEFSCTGSEFAVASHWGQFEDVFCAKDETLEFIENVIAEIVELFPGKYIHIGGDEFSKTRWQNCENCQAKLEELGLENEEELKNYFLNRIENFAASKGKQILMRDTINVSLNFSYCYSQNSTHRWLCADGYLPLENVYDFVPAPEQIGSQANLWSEYLTSEMYVEYMLLPRITALSEALWTPSEQKKFEEFRLRLSPMLKRFDAMNIVYSSQ